MKFNIGDIVTNKRGKINNHKLVIIGYGIPPHPAWLSVNYYEAKPIVVDNKKIEEDVLPARFRKDYLENEYKIDNSYLRRQKLKKLKI